VTRFFRWGLSVPGPFGCRCLNIPIMSRFHTPLIEPDGRYLRIRLSEETSRFRPRKAARPLRKPNKTKRIVQDFVRKPPGRRPCLFLFGTQPLTQPLAGMSFHGLIGFADRSKTEVIGPTVHHLIEFPHHRLMIRLGSISSRFATDRITDADHSLLSRNRAQIGPSRLCRVAAAKRVPKKSNVSSGSFETASWSHSPSASASSS
jgi:hypothetical protein